MRPQQSRRSRSRSRTPPVREKPKKVVNMLNMAALSEVKEAHVAKRKPFHERVTGGPPSFHDRVSGGPFRAPRVESTMAPRVEAPEGGPERNSITCTIEGSGVRRSVFNRVSGGNFESRGRFDGSRSFDGGNNRSFDSRRSEGNRSFTTGERRIVIPADGGPSFPERFPARRSFGDRASQRDEDDSFRRRREEGEDGEKPVMKLVDPQEVPRSNRFFTHDDRGGDDREWRGRDMYDPRKDTGRYGERGRFDRDRRDRDYGNNREYGNREHGSRGDYGNNRRFDRDDRRGDRDRREGGAAGGGGWDGFRQNGNGYTGSRFGSRNSGVDGVWAHDKYLELETADEGVLDMKEDDATNGDDGVLVIDSSKTERTVE